jgi:hypothetical protein
VAENDWPFDQKPNVAAMTTVNVVEKNYPIFMVTHYEDDHAWAVLCGTTDNADNGRKSGLSRGGNYRKVKSRSILMSLKC